MADRTGTGGPARPPRPQGAGPDPGDPFRLAVYEAEDTALPDGGRRFVRFAELTEWVRSAIADPWWEATFPGAPVEVDVMRRSRGSTFSAAHVDRRADAAVIWVREGSWNAVTVVHELAHVATPRTSALRTATARTAEPHGAEYVGALLGLWRRHLGLHAYGALRSALAARGVPLSHDLLDRGAVSGR